MRAFTPALVRAYLSLTCLALVSCRQTRPVPPPATPEPMPVASPVQTGNHVGPTGGPRIHQLALGDRHTCALMSDGRVLCWGANQNGQLGDGTRISRSQPTRATVVDQLNSDNLVSLTAGGDRTCVVAGETREWLCWGDVPTPKGVVRSQTPLPELANEGHAPQPLLRAKLGPRWVCGIRDASEVVCRPNFQRGTPVPIVSPTGFQADLSLAVGQSHACLTRGAGVLCWGDNRHGQLGDGSRQARSVGKPTTVRHIVDGNQVVAGDDHTCIITKTHRELGCWGANADGQLGTAPGGERASVLAVPNLSPARTAAAAGTHTCALTDGSSGDELRCWGSWDTGQACRNEQLPQPTDASEIIDLAAGSNLCMATRGGLVVCSDTRYNGPVTRRPPPKRRGFSVVPGVHGVVQLTAGLDHVCARTSTGSVTCWGANKQGELGIGMTGVHDQPGTPPLSNVVQIEAGQTHTCARDREGQVFCWGDNGWGQLGHAGERLSPEPTKVEGLGPVVELAAGGDRTCVVEQSGQVKCWGYGPLGDGTEESSAKPVGVRVKADIIDLELGDYHMCGRSSKGELFCWGSNYMGELGMGNRRDQRLPTKVSGVRNPVAVMTAVYRTCVHNAKGQVQCTGTNVSGQLGDGTRRTKTRLTKVRATSQPSRKLTGGIRYTCSLTQTGTVECWGPVPGMGDVGMRATPLPDLKPQLTGYVQAIAANEGPRTTEVCEHKAPTLRTPTDPPLAILPPSKVGTLAAGHDHDCYMVDRRTVYCWGRNDHGQVGDGTHDFRNTPQQVMLPN